MNDFIQPGSSILDEPVGLLFFEESRFVSSATLDKVLQFDASEKLIEADFIPNGSGGLNGPVFLTSFVAPVLLGDLNGDGMVDLLDVEPFVDSLLSGIFVAEADINQDGVVDLLDVGPFIALLSG